MLARPEFKVMFLYNLLTGSYKRLVMSFVYVIAFARH